MGNSPAVKHLVERYVNGIIYWHWHEKKMSYDSAINISQAIAELETSLKIAGVTPDQIEKLIYFGNYFKDVLKDLGMVKLNAEQIDYIIKSSGITA